MTVQFRRLLSASRVALITSLALISLQGATLIEAQTKQGDPNPPLPGCRAYAQTGKQLCGRFQQYWDVHGGLAQQGYPISNELEEKSDVDGKVYTVQYFERAVFEAHPELKEPYDVLLTLLGKLQYEQKYPNGAPNQHVSTAAGATKFPQTGRTVGGTFLAYWNEHGGVAQQGYPISEEFTEVSALDGRPYTVQYFERAIFELHPENKPPYNVLLSQLGTFRYKAKYPVGEPPAGATPAASTPLAQGTWGGEHLEMTVSANGATFEFDCATAQISDPLTISNARLDVTGIYVQEHGGADKPDEVDRHPARFIGTLNGTTLQLSITLTDSNEVVGPYTLTLGQPGNIRKCM